MKILIDQPRTSWAEILKRPALDNRSLQDQVSIILNEVKLNGDIAVKQFTHQFDGVELETNLVSKDEVDLAVNQLSDDLKNAIQLAANNIRYFHEKQITKPEIIETMPGVTCWRKSVGIEKVGLYIPGGTAPLFSTILMLGIPASIAGCKDVILCSPPDKNGHLHSAILFTAQLVGIKKIYKIGGVQAIAAMAYGTKLVAKVDKIFGPGNQYVTAAKQIIQQDGVAIDMPAGPSEVCVLADDSANPAFVAADLLSQAEHGVDSQVLLISNSILFVEKVNMEIKKQVEFLPRKDIAKRALENSKAIVVGNMEDAIDLVNEYAAEHLIIACKNETEIGEKIINAGSVFLGNYSPESVGDYASGTNHTLPTNGYAKAYSGVSIDSFVKKITFQQLSKTGLNNIADAVEKMAEAEGLIAHAQAVRIRR